MTDKEYNYLCLPFQFLTKRFHNFQNIYDGEYKCYDPKMYGVREDYLKLLLTFENLTYRHIFNNNHTTSLIALGHSVDSNLVLIEEQRILVHQELGNIIFHVLANKLKGGVEDLITLLEKIKKAHPNYIKSDADGNIISMKTYRYDEFIIDFENLENYKYVKHLFYDSGSGVISLNLENEIDFRVYQMKQILDRLSNFNFVNIVI